MRVRFAQPAVPGSVRASLGLHGKQQRACRLDLTKMNQGFGIHQLRER
ncbi:MAG: hypothetical protein Q8L84_05360 [Hyphomonas sp.]|nr:hypothetical protein [Hyphomonas sp.]